MNYYNKNLKYSYQHLFIKLIQICLCQPLQSFPFQRVFASFLVNLIFANVDLGRLHEVELFIGGLFHEVEARVLQHVL